jgi:hypothetical protein
MDKHTLALVSIVGSSLDLLGAVYLAYDLLGGEHGPLRTLTRTVTYGALFGSGYGLALGPFFGLVTGLAHGLTLGWEFSRRSRQVPAPRLWQDLLASFIRGAGFGIGAAHLRGAVFGLAFGVLSFAGQVVAYRLGIRPTLDYKSMTRPQLTSKQMLSSVNRSVGYVIAGYLSSLVANQPGTGWAFGLEAGLAIGLVTTIAIMVTPFIEWAADNMPARRMGVLGIGFMLAGFAMQSVQYWVAYFDVRVV